MTLGSKGAFYSISEKNMVLFLLLKWKQGILLTAGDTFIGALASKLSRDLSNIEGAIKYGSKAASLTIQLYGAQPSIPYQNEFSM